MPGTIIGTVNEREGLRPAAAKESAFAERHAPMLLFLPIVSSAGRQMHRGALVGRRLRAVPAPGEEPARRQHRPGHRRQPLQRRQRGQARLQPVRVPVGLADAAGAVPAPVRPRLRPAEAGRGRLFCGFLWVFHEVIRARAQRWVAFGVVVVVGTTLAYLVHTDHLSASCRTCSPWPSRSGGSIGAGSRTSSTWPRGGS